MVVDTLERGAHYPLGRSWLRLCSELKRFAERAKDLDEGSYPLGGGPDKGGVMAKIEVYEPREREDAFYESHERMADIQLVISGDEYMDVYPLTGREARTLRDMQKDAIVYADKPEATTRVHLVPGTFALVMPGEAHMPCLRAGSETVKKCVVKIPTDMILVPLFSEPWAL